MNTYKNKHKEEVVRATQLWECGDITRENLEYIFPELAESKDERIRKALIEYFKSYKEIGTCGAETFNGIPTDNILAWLEKQKEFVSADFDDVWDTADCDELTAPLEKYSKDAIKKMCHAWYDKGIELERRNWLEKQGEQNDSDVKDYNSIDPHFGKSIDKIEPKFHKGDWIVHHGTGNIYQVVAVIDNQYQLKYGDTYTIQNCADVDRCARLWDVTKDAKDGDVLASKNGGTILIFRNLDTNTGFSSYYNTAGKGELGWSNNRFIPATKEQRDQLEKAMTDAGYKWDAEKKELRKIENSPILSNSSNTGKQWTEEDDTIRFELIRRMEVLDHYWNRPNNQKLIDWLKSLKQRMEELQ